MQRAGLIAAVLAMMLFGTASVAMAQDVRPGKAQGAATAQTGWWWRANDKPDTGSVDPVRPTEPTVPEGALPVSAAAGEPEKISAIEFALDADPGASVTTFLLALREGDHEGANVGADAPGTKVAACQITDSFWASEESAAWTTRPEHDKDSCVPGSRAENGVWTFDLTSLAGEWLAEDGTTSPSVMLVPKSGDTPANFQVTYDGTAEDGIGLRATFEGGTPPPRNDPVTAPEDDAFTGGDVQDDGAGFGGGGGDAPPPPPADAGFPATGSDGPSIGDGVPAAADIPTAKADSADSKEPAETDPALAAEPIARPPGLLDGIPTIVWFLIPVALVLAYLVAVGLGAPVAGSTGRGVSRALERWRTGTGAEGVQS